MSAAPQFTPAQDLHERILGVHAEYRRSERDLAVLLAELADSRLYLDLGFASVGLYAERLLDLSRRQTRALIQIGRALPGLPHLDRAFAEGRLGWTKAREMMPILTPGNEAAWIERAAELTSRELERHVQAAGVGEPPPSHEDAEKGESRTRVVLEMDAQEADVLRAAIEMLRQSADVNKDEIGDGALVAEMARRVLHDAEATEAPTGERYRTVLEHCPRCRHTSGIEAEVDTTHVGLAQCCGEVQEMEGPRRGRLSRTIPPAVRRAVLHRDRWRCRVPGCTHHLWLEPHHIEEFWRGGDHSEANLITLCSVHHKVVHAGLLAIRRAEDGTVEFERADGVVLRDPRGSPGGGGVTPG